MLNFCFTFECLLFVYFFINILINKKDKSFTAAGICLLFSIIFFIAATFLNTYYSLFGDVYGFLLSVKSILFIAALIYLQIYFYKIAKGLPYKNNLTVVRRNTKNHFFVKNTFYLTTSIEFLLQCICIPLYTNTLCYIRLYEIIPALALGVFLIYQLLIFPKIGNKAIMVFWLVSSFCEMIFFIIFFMENFFVKEYTILLLLKNFFKILQLIFLLKIVFYNKKVLKGCFDD
jgi:hypothetical protein